MLLAALLAAQVVQAVRIFPTPRALWNDDYPVLVVDHAIHLYHGALGSRFLREHGTTWGYDPFFMAGYPETPVWDSSSNPSILFQALAGGGYHPRAYNLGLVICSIVAVASIPAGAAAAGASLGEAALAGLLGWLYFYCGWPDMFWRSGLFAYVTASGGLVLLTGMLLQFDANPTIARWLALTGIGTALWFTHVTAPVMVAGGGLAFVAATLRRHSWRWRMALVAAAIVALAVNLVWLLPLWRFRDIRAPQAFFMAPPSAWTFLGQFLGGGVDGYVSLLLTLLGVSGFVVWLIDRRFTRAATFGGTIAVCLALAMFGGMWDATKTLEPLRFRVPLNMLLAVPAGSLLAHVNGWATARLGGGRRGARLAAAGWLALIAAACLAMPLTRDVVVQRLSVTRPLVAGLQPEMRTLVDWLAKNTDGSGRILFEDQLRLYEDTDAESTHWTPLLPLLLGKEARQFVGGIYHSAFILHNQRASFGDFHLAGRRIDAWPGSQFQHYAMLYNAGWVVCWSPLAREYFDHLSTARKVATIPRFHTPNRPGSVSPQVWEALATRNRPAIAARYVSEADREYWIYQLDRPRNFFISGEGKVARVDYNRIELTDVVPAGDTVVLSLHWLDTLRTEPPFPVEPVTAPDDPVPFVRIATDQRLKRLVLYNGYGR
jgi:hypothetical protein